MRTVATISQAHNYIRIYDFYGEFIERVITPFCRAHLFKTGKVPIPGSHKTGWKVTHVFARSNYQRDEFRLPAALLKEFMDFAQHKGYNPSRIKLEIEPELVGKKVKFEFQPGYENMRPGQDEWINYQLAPGPLKVNNASTGFGKAQTLSSKVKVPGGWTTMGEIKAGDYVTGQNGKPTKVLDVYPQGITKVSRVTFADGRYTDVNPEHLWNIFDHKKRTWKTVSTVDIKDLLNGPSKDRVHVPLCLPEDGVDKAFKIHPYLMGVLLGDGGFTQGNVTINKPYRQVFDRISSLLPEHLECKWRDDVTFVILFKKDRNKEDVWHVRDGLHEHGLMGLKSHEKAVPVEYLHGSAKQRLELLQGLMDTDGTIGVGGSPSFSSSSEKLSQAVQYLVRSLGGIASLKFRSSKYTYKGEVKQGRGDYRVSIRFPNPEDLFTLEHKRVRSTQGQYSATLKLRVVDVTDRPDEPTQCIMVEADDHLYVTDDFIVTHNTYMALHTMLKIGERTLITVQPRYITTWMTALGETLKLGPEDVLLWEFDLGKLPDALEKNDLNPKVIIVPMTRIDVYFRNEKKDPNIPTLDKVLERLGCGLRIIDEGHEAIHQICMSLMYGNFPKLLLLSATLTADDPFINKIYKIMFPFNIRLKEPEPENYIDIVAFSYDINPRKYNLKTQQFGSYNDLTWEQSILGNKAVTRFYFEVAKKAFEDYYLDVQEEGTKCLFFFSRVNTCAVMLAMFKEEYPSGDFATFTGDDTKVKETKNKYLEHEIVITTPGSCGTGKDIPGLVTVISFHMVSSTQRNKQMIGRLRDIRKKFGGKITPRFVFPMCISQPKHREYFKKREVAFEAKKKTLKVIDSFCSLN